jgi:hypothetical protein
MNVINFMGSQAGRGVRVVLGVALIGVGVALGGGGWVLAVIGLVPLTTAGLDVCLLAPLVNRPLRGAKFRAAH